jgi:hypothetical protein
VVNCTVANIYDHGGAKFHDRRHFRNPQSDRLGRMPTRRWTVAILAVLLTPIPAAAQHPFEVVGGRAQGMGGAFVAVADDASAVYWNPAGLASGQPYGATIEWNRLRFGNPDDVPAPGPGAGKSSFTSLGTWPIGISYGRFVTSQLVTGPGGETWSETLQTRDFGVTILQTIVPGLVVGSTLKYVRGGTSFGPSEGQTASQALERSADLDRRTTGAFDLDLGLMADLERVRIGLTVKNLREPEFGEVEETAIALDRQARLGVAVLPTDGLTLAMDIDLNTVDLRDGLRRMIAFGGETRIGSRLAVRGGVRWNREDSANPVTTVGASVAVRTGLWLDGHYAYGKDAVARGLGVALRAGY